MTDRGEGSAVDIYYNPQVHGDPLLYPQAFVEVPEMKLQDPIRQMDPEQYQLWDQFYLFQESWEKLPTSRASEGNHVMRIAIHRRLP